MLYITLLFFSHSTVTSDDVRLVVAVHVSVILVPRNAIVGLICLVMSGMGLLSSITQGVLYVDLYQSTYGIIHSAVKGSSQHMNSEWDFFHTYNVYIHNFNRH